jgi:hypothetical protein
MVKETFICEIVNLISHPDTSLKERYENVADFFYTHYEMKIYFCQLFGKRWSFIAGKDDIFCEDKRIILSKKLGIIIENNQFSDDEWKNVIKCCFARLINE